jgi:hypothetical protein
MTATLELTRPLLRPLADDLLDARALPVTEWARALVADELPRSLTEQCAGAAATTRSRPYLR